MSSGAYDKSSGGYRDTDSSDESGSSGGNSNLYSVSISQSPSMSYMVRQQSPAGTARTPASLRPERLLVPPQQHAKEQWMQTQLAARAHAAGPATAAAAIPVRDRPPRTSMDEEISSPSKYRALQEAAEVQEEGAGPCVSRPPVAAAAAGPGANAVAVPRVGNLGIQLSSRGGSASGAMSTGDMSQGGSSGMKD